MKDRATRDGRDKASYRCTRHSAIAKRTSPPPEVLPMRGSKLQTPREEGANERCSGRSCGRPSIEYSDVLTLGMCLSIRAGGRTEIERAKTYLAYLSNVSQSLAFNSSSGIPRESTASHSSVSSLSAFTYFPMPDLYASLPTFRSSDAPAREYKFPRIRPAPGKFDIV